MTQENFILNLFEKICRSNIYLFLISRYLIGKYFSKLIFDSDFKIIKILKKNKFFKSNKLIVDIGANDGMSYNIIRKFDKNCKIISFEPNLINFENLKKIEKKDFFFKCFKFALSDKNQKKNFFTPYFKNYPITQMAGVNKAGVKKRLESSLFIKNMFKKINFKKQNIEVKKLDYFKLKPQFIKIDIEGHEYECVKGSIKTIIKHKPILMIEYDKNICDKIYSLIRKYNYKKYMYDKTSKKIIKFKNQKIFNIFFINNKFLKFIK